MNNFLIQMIKNGVRGGQIDPGSCFLLKIAAPDIMIFHDRPHDAEEGEPER
jgi:hypothetical protein